jgi:hypothetical protein
LYQKKELLMNLQDPTLVAVLVQGDFQAFFYTREERKKRIK